jgi:hypothetical protein
VIAKSLVYARRANRAEGKLMTDDEILERATLICINRFLHAVVKDGMPVHEAAPLLQLHDMQPVWVMKALGDVLGLDDADILYPEDFAAPLRVV